MNAAREKMQFTYNGKHIRIAAPFSMETLKATRFWSNTLLVFKNHHCQARLPYVAKLSPNFPRGGYIPSKTIFFFSKQKEKFFTA